MEREQEVVERDTETNVKVLDEQEVRKNAMMQNTLATRRFLGRG